MKPATELAMQQYSNNGALICKLRYCTLLLAVSCLLSACNHFGKSANIPAGFVDIQSVIPDIVLEVRYAGTDNFVGAPISGYEAAKVYLTREAAVALSAVQAELATEGLGVKVFDGYRPQRAVDHFVRWAEDADDTRMQARYYPSVAKEDLFSEGYIAARSGHSRGSTLDLTLIDRQTGNELDMGAPWDFFDPISWPGSTAVNAAQFANRMRLQNIMQRHGFVPLDTEWWHFTLQNEPYTRRFFDFVIR